ncbi:hypothetical protein [Candidatus Clostridium helianthi]|uniref:Uncharacterized protein n=1 Tax=Candidatus Clostridium helianthi TaxID=3381660 RepID=A0ABW8S8T0_9CLOT
MSRFVPNKLVQECIQNNDIRGLRGAFVGIIFSDRSFSKGEFKNTLDYICEETNLKILESFDNGELLSKKINEGNITEDDFGEAVYNLKVNFCKERIDDVKKIGKHLYGKSLNSENTVSSTAHGGTSHGKKTQCHHQKKMNAKKESKAGLVVAGIVTVAAIAVAVSFIMKSMK